MVQLVDMVGLFHLYIVLGELVHNLSQIFVDCREDGYTYREVRGPEQGLAFCCAGFLHVIAMFLHPACRTTHHLDTGLPGFQIIAISGLRCCKLYCNIS